MGRFAHLIDSPSGMEGFRARYHISLEVSLRYCAPGQWLTHRGEGEVTILMISFIEGEMRLPVGRVTRNYLITYRLCPYQCTPKMCWVLGSVDALNEQMGLNLT